MLCQTLSYYNYIAENSDGLFIKQYHFYIRGFETWNHYNQILIMIALLYFCFLVFDQDEDKTISNRGRY